MPCFFWSVLKMKITRCKYGHYYDKAYFRECPHCCRARGGKDEDIIIKNTEQNEGLSDKNRVSGNSQDAVKDEDYSQKEKDRENVKRWIGEAWDELEEILSESNENDEQRENNKNNESTEKRKYSINNRAEKERIKREIKEKEKDEKIVEKETERKNEKDIRKESGYEKITESYMLFAAMPLKVIKNQEFCMDFCLLPEKEWETGAKMLEFKSQESIRDLKPVQMALPAKAVLHILYKEEEICHKEIELDSETGKVFCTFPVTVTDTRDRRFHMIKVVFEIEEQTIEIPLYLMPNP